MKIRGFRIELGEIEAALAQCQSVRESAVVAREDDSGQKRLIAYVAGSLDPLLVRRQLAEKLPEHMVPAAIVVLDSLPLNGNGKVDRAALPLPLEAKLSLADDRDDNEAHVASVWTAVLGREVKLDDNFFDLGGSSIDVVEVHARLRERFGNGLSLMALFEHPTVRTLAGHLKGCSVPGANHNSDRAPRSATARGLGPEAFGERGIEMSDLAQTGNIEGGVAIIGMAGRFPRARDVNEFWRNIRDGMDCISRFTPADIEVADASDRRQDADYVAARSVLDDVDLFDAAFFGILPSEAE